MEDFILNLLQQLDVSSLSEVDWTSIGTYAALFTGGFGAVWYSFKDSLHHIWLKVEKPVAFTVHSIALFAIWFAVFRLELSSTFNLDREVYDDLLIKAGVIFTPLYLVQYNLVFKTGLFIFRFCEFWFDILFLSWNETTASNYRKKWGGRVESCRDRAVAYFKSFVSIPNAE